MPYPTSARRLHMMVTSLFTSECWHDRIYGNNTNYADICPSLERVVLMLTDKPVVNVPLLNFQTFASEKMPQLKTKITEGETHRWRFYTYNASGFMLKDSVQKWASWLTHRDLRAVINGGHEEGDSIVDALSGARFLRDPDYRDALVDAWMLWLQHEEPAGNLDVKRLQHFNWSNDMWTGRLKDLKCALVLHHDAGAVTMEDGENSDLVSYSTSICKRVRDLALFYFSQPGRKPKDPLQLSDKEFCEEYHSHSKYNKPCYKTKRLPEQL